MKRHDRAAHERDLRRRMLELLADCPLGCSREDHEAFADAFVASSRPALEREAPAEDLFA